MNNDLSNIKAGDNVFYFTSYEKYPQVKQVKRVTGNFVLIQFGSVASASGNWEKKFRKGNGSEVCEYSSADRLATIEPGEIEKFEKQKADEKRIGQILTELNGKKFKFFGYQQWYSVEKWEKILAAVNE